MKNKICKACGLEYLPNGRRQLYCSITCGTRVWKSAAKIRKQQQRETVNCKVCNIEFKAIFHGVKTQVTCSMQCRRELRNARSRVYFSRSQRKAIKRTNNCIVCGDEFIAVANKKTCSVKCCRKNSSLKFKAKYQADPHFKARTKEKFREYQKKYYRRDKAITNAVRELGLITPGDL